MSESEITLKSLHDEILKSRDELKRGMQAVEANIILEVETLRKKVSILEEENADLRGAVQILEGRVRKNNLVIYGLNSDVPETLSANSICHEINKLLGLKLVESDINDVYHLGRSKNSPIKVELLSYRIKRGIFQNLRMLKGKEVYFAHDLTKHQREEYNQLRGYLSNLRDQNISNCQIRGNRLYIENTAYTLEELRELQEVPFKRTNSAPPTPNVEKYQERTQRTPNEQRALQQDSQLVSKSVQSKNKAVLRAAAGPTDKGRQESFSAGTSGTQLRGSLSYIAREKMKTRSKK